MRKKQVQRKQKLSGVDHEKARSEEVRMIVLKAKALFLRYDLLRNDKITKE